MRGVAVARRVGTLLTPGLLLTPRLALACSPAVTPPAAIDPFQVPFDSEPPVLADVRLSELERGVYDGCVVSSSITLSADAWDDQTPADALGYRVELLRGNGPQPSAEPMAYMYLAWVDDGAEPIDVELRVRAVDGAGNESNPIDIRVNDAANYPAESGCNVAGPSLLPHASRRALAWWLPVLAALSWRLRRPR